MGASHRFVDGSGDPRYLELHEDGSNLTEAQYTALSRVVLTLYGTGTPQTVDSAVSSNLSIDTVNRRLALTLGLEAVPEGRYLTEVTVFSPDHPSGVKFAEPGQYIVRKES